MNISKSKVSKSIGKDFEGFTDHEIDIQDEESEEKTELVFTEGTFLSNPIIKRDAEIRRLKMEIDEMKVKVQDNEKLKEELASEKESKKIMKKEKDRQSREMKKLKKQTTETLKIMIKTGESWSKIKQITGAMS